MTIILFLDCVKELYNDVDVCFDISSVDFMLAISRAP